MNSRIHATERVELFNKKKRDEKFHGMRSEQELRKQMDMIERSAREAMAADRAAAAEDGQVSRCICL